MIHANDDLNNYRTPGTYVSAISTISQTLQNCPYTSCNFKLFVIQNTGTDSLTNKYLSQTIFTSTSRIFHRGLEGNNSWLSWKCLTDDYSSISLQINGYIVFTNGLILQWSGAAANLLEQTGAYDAPLPVAYTSNHYLTIPHDFSESDVITPSQTQVTWCKNNSTLTSARIYVSSVTWSYGFISIGI